MEKAFWIVDLILPITMIAISFFYKRKAKKDISRISGFRTSETMENKKLWEEAHLLASKLLLFSGIILTAIVCAMKSFISMDAAYLSLIDNTISLIVFIAITIYVQSKVSRKSL